MFHIKFLFNSYNRLISVSSEPLSLENRVHVNYLSNILYKYFVQVSPVTARTALWSPLIWASDRVITNTVHHKHTVPDLGAKSFNCYGSYLIENTEGRAEGRDVNNAKWAREINKLT